MACWVSPGWLSESSEVSSQDYAWGLGESLDLLFNSRNIGWVLLYAKLCAGARDPKRSSSPRSLFSMALRPNRDMKMQTSLNITVTRAREVEGKSSCCCLMKSQEASRRWRPLSWSSASVGHEDKYERISWRSKRKPLTRSFSLNNNNNNNNHSYCIFSQIQDPYYISFFHFNDLLFYLYEWFPPIWRHLSKMRFSSLKASQWPPRCLEQWRMPNRHSARHAELKVPPGGPGVLFCLHSPNGKPILASWLLSFGKENHKVRVLSIYEKSVL